MTEGRLSLRKIKYPCHYFLDAVEDTGSTIQKLWQKSDASPYCVSPRRLEELPLTLGGLVLFSAHDQLRPVVLTARSRLASGLRRRAPFLVKVGGERLFVVERHFKSCARVA